jgi:UDP-N-acetylglucosamine 2-epimerase
MKKIKIITIVGTRPEIIRLSRIISNFDKYFEHYLIHTGQNYDYELNKIFFDDLNIRQPDFFLNAAGKSSSETIGNIFIKIEDVLDSIKPDGVLILGDTNSCLSSIVVKKKKIPIFHMEAGNRCFDIRVPEEVNRKIVDHISDLNLTYSDISRSYLIKEGLDPQYIIKTGSPMKEVLTYYKEGILESKIMATLQLKKFQFFLISAHREENIDSDNNFIKLANLLNLLADKFKFPILVSTHPRTRKRIDSTNIVFNNLIKFIKPLGFKDYNNLQINAKVVLSDSGTITEESSILNFPALNIREAQERPEGFEEGSVMMVGLNPDRVLNALEILENQSRDSMRMLSEVSDYNTTNVSEKVVRIIISYIDYINQNIWKKNQH